MNDVTLHVRTDAGDRDIRLTPAQASETLADVLRHQHLPLNTRCAGRGVCDACVVELRAGTLVHRSAGQSVTAAATTDTPVRVRGCEYRVDGGEAVTVHVPARSLVKYAPQVVTTFRTNIPAGHDPLVDDVRPGDVGIAIDVGTTTVVVLIVDLTSGAVLASAAGFNRQMHLGDDVLTRINLCHGGPSVVRSLQRAVTDDTITPLLADARQQLAVPSTQETGSDLRAPATRHRTRVVTVAANTTMLHLLAGVDPSPMGVAPFTPAFLEHRVLTDLRLAGVAADVPIHLLPGCSAYVGADLAAGVVATGMLYDADATTLLVDIGTNGEIILNHRGRLYGCATAAGPAFEGAGLSFGTRAGRGAVSHLRLDAGAVGVEIIGGEGMRATGICGSAYVDVLAEGVRTGLLGLTGRIDVDAAGALRDHVIPWQEHGRAVRVARDAGGEPVVVSESDIAKLLQAKAAIAAGILTLLRRAGLQPSDVRTLYLAGGFGMHIDVGNAIACGLLPGFDPRQVQVVGNTSLAGAFLTLLDRTLLADLDRVRRNMDVVELNKDPEFESCYVDQLMLGL